MHKIILIFLLSLGIITNISAQSIKAMTYNIRYDNPNDGENRWDKRKDFLADQIKFYEPDFLGTQEGLEHQLSFLDSTLSQYNFIGVGKK